MFFRSSQMDVNLEGLSVGKVESLCLIGTTELFYDEYNREVKLSA